MKRPFTAIVLVLLALPLAAEGQDRYTDERLGRLRVVRDFLPPPEDLVFRDEGVKVRRRGAG